MLHPFLRHDAGMKDRRPWIVLSQFIFDARERASVIAAGDDEQIGAAQLLHGLAQPSEREYVSAAERIEGVDQDDVHLSRKLQMLESIVEDQYVNAELLLHQLAREIAIRPNADRRDCRAQEHLRLVARMRDR